MKIGVSLASILVFCSFLILFTAAPAICACPLADLSGDCIVDMTDLLMFTDNWMSIDLPDHAALAARWHLDESSGEIATDDAGGHHGLLHNDPQWMPLEGHQQGSLFFDGIDDYIEIPDYPGINGTASRTCSAWINTSDTNTRAILSWGNYQPGQKWMFHLGSNGLLSMAVVNGNIQAPKAVNDGEWHHVAAVLMDDGSPSVNEILLYIDGVLQTDTTVNYNQSIDTLASENVLIGAIRYTAGIGFHFQGLIDEVQIYNEALMAEDVLRLYQIGSALRHSPDLNTDSKVNIEDYAVLSSQWQSDAPRIIISEFLASNGAENPPLTEQGQIRDGNGESSDWIELYNQTDFPIDLADWAMTDNQYDLLRWQFPENTVLQGHHFLVVFASGKDASEYPYVDSLGYLHTNFNLSANGEFLALVRPDGTPEFAFDSVLNPETGEYGYPEQVENISYGMLYDTEYYFALPSPESENRGSFLGFVDTPDFSHERGYYSSAFELTLTTDTEGAVIRYTTNGTEPTLSNGFTYTIPFTISSNKSVRAAAFKPGYETSKVRTKTYILGATAAIKSMPAVYLGGSNENTFYNPYGVTAIVGGYYSGGIWTSGGDPGAYNNFLGHGMDYERPVSMEYVDPDLGLSFQEDCGIRIQGSEWIRPRYTAPSVDGIWSGNGKPSLRLYFRGAYGETKLRHSVLEQFPEVDDMDAIVLRAGHNDQTNPFVRDEMIRRLQYYMGHQASLGTFVNLYINSIYKGYFNLCERINEDFCQKYYDSDLEWDVVGWVAPAQGASYLEVRDGDAVAFNEFITYANTHDLSDPIHYNNIISQLDLNEFIDYLIVQCWGGNWDWPQNNWSATGERSQDRKWRFYVWDAEGAMDGNLTQDRFGTLNSDSSSLSRLYQALRVNQDFKIAFSDRLQKHFYESDSVMLPAFLDSLFWQLAKEVEGVIPSINTYIPYTYIPGRNSIFINQCKNQGLFTFQGPRMYLNGRETGKQDEGLENSQLSFQNASGTYGSIYFTLDGSDPRLSATEQAQSSSVILIPENAPKRVLIPTSDIGTSWMSNISYNDTGWNAGLPVDLSKTGGVGYERESVGNRAYISYDIEDEMYNKRTSAYIRIPFSVDPGEMANWNYMTLSMRYDDGFVVYLNGTEICRRNFTGTPLWNSKASPEHENNSIEAISLNTFLWALQPGDNLLAIHGLNNSTTSTDVIISPILEAGNNGLVTNISPRAQLYTSPVTLQKSDRIKVRTLNGSTWSALRQADIVIGHVTEDLRISELMYHPNGDPNEEYIELTNIGPDPINLKYTAFTEGIHYTFGDTVLEPDDFLLLVQNQSIFENRYGTGLPIAGEYEGVLSDAGEKIKLRNLLNNKIQTVDYGDGWYDITDGEGFSLTAIDPASEKTLTPVHNLAAAWNFNETSGTTVLDSVGLHNGTILNMSSTERVLGRENKALFFDGDNDYVKITGYQGIAGTTSRTCSAWIKTTDTDNNLIVSWGTFQPGQKWMFHLGPNGLLRVAVMNGYIESTAAVNDGEWHHVAAVLIDDGSPSVNEIVLYIDGVLQTGTTVNNNQSINTIASQDVMIGAVLNTTVTEGHFKGVIDDIRIYDEALSQEEIALLAGDIWDQKEYWRPSAAVGGSPGYDDSGILPAPGAVVINEVLAHSHTSQPDWIELHNTTGQLINIGGWFLSDSNTDDLNIMKYEIPLGTSIPAHGYTVFYENLHFNNPGAPGVNIPFALSEGGDTVYLRGGSEGVIAGYEESESFGASASGVAFGRHIKSVLDGGINFVSVSENTPGAVNAYPMVGPVIITEIMYNPDGSNTGNEYLELKNISPSAVTLQDLVSTETSPGVSTDQMIPWKFSDGIDFVFPANTTIPAGGHFIIAKDPAAFSAYYGAMPPGVTVLGPFQGGTSLSNGGEQLQIVRPGDQEYGSDRYWIRTERVTYDDETPWPTSPDGFGDALHQKTPDTAGANYGNDVINWQAAAPSPGY